VERPIGLACGQEIDVSLRGLAHARHVVDVAVIATAHMLARIIYRMWKYREAYQPLSLDHYEAKYRERTLASLRKRAASLGFELVHSPAVSGGVS
jgi:xanthine/CO dehydrogenase XdhC/CoxF family maturation factor